MMQMRWQTTVTFAMMCALSASPSLTQTTATPDATVEASKPVAVVSTRQSVGARPDDAAGLKRGLSLYIGSMAGGAMTMVEYGVKDGKVTYRVTTGALTPKTKKAVEKAVKKLQSRL